MMDVLKGVHNFVKKRRIISGALSHFGHPKLAKTARQLGYGQAGGARRRRSRASKKVSAPIRRARSIGVIVPSKRRVASAVSAASFAGLKRRAMKGRGRWGETLGGLAGSLLPF